jgi:predicted CXXCH cytochrome family protein
MLVTVLAALARAGDHPVPLDPKMDPAKCLECHEDKAKAKYVHSAIAGGCTSCHEIKTEGENTQVNLSQPVYEICFTCHAKEAKDEDTKHGPWDKGQCVFCHDPHTSDYPKQLRAEGNALCLECHDARKGPLPETINLFGKREIKREELEGLRRLRLNADLTRGHPLGNHWVSTIADPTNGPGAKMTCLTCHVPHFSTEDKLARVITVKDEAGKEKQIDVCNACHDAYDRQRVEDMAKNAPAIEKQIEEQKKAAAKVRMEYLKRLPKLAGDDRDNPSTAKPTDSKPKEKKQ